MWKDGSLFDSSSKNASNDEPQPSSDDGKKDDEGVNKESGIDDRERHENSTQYVNTAGLSINTASINVNTGSLNINNVSSTVTTAPLEATYVDFFGDETEVDMSNIMCVCVSSVFYSNTRIIKKAIDHSLDHVIGDVQSGEEPKKVIQVLKDPSWIEAMQEQHLQFKLQQVWTLVDLPHGKRAIGTKWVYMNKKDERGIVIKNKARLVAQRHTQEEGIDYDEMDVKSAFLYGKIEEEVYVCQPSGFEDPEFPNRVYKVEKTLYGLHQSPRAWYETLSTYLLDNRFQRGLQVTQKDDRIFISQDKYMDEILKKFGFLSVKTASTPMETSNPLLRDAEAEDVDVHLYRSMIGSLMYLTSLRPDIMFDDKFSDFKTMLDYGYNFMNTKIFIDNESTICIVKNPVFHSKTKHIEIRHHFIRDSNEKKLIQASHSQPLLPHRLYKKSARLSSQKHLILADFNI
ncbi:putative ribonuclease H-like domain-containing protein [Tanacetum coccineum]